MDGAEKPLLRVGEDTIAQRTTEILARIGSEVLVATPRPEAWSSLPVRVVADALENAGPLGGIVAGLEASRTAWLLAVGGDMPFLDERLLAALCRRAIATGRTVIPRRDDRPEPLHAVYSCRHAERARTALMAGERRAWGWLDEGEVEWVELTGDAARSVAGVNTTGELEAARELARLDGAPRRKDTRPR
jgi:molybdopterin-guanine dinucleotide biosynthesis protein A